MHVRDDWLAQPLDVQKSACERERRCLSYGARLALGEGIARDMTAAQRVFDAACTAKDMLACVNSAKLAHAPLERFVLLCDAGVGEACLEAGNMIRFGDAASTHTPAEGMRFYERGCDRGVGNACLRLGFHYGTGLAVKRDDRRSFDLMNEACACHDDHGCSGVAYMLHNGEGVPHDFARARSIFEGLCTRHVESACVHLGVMYHQGDGVPVDASYARELFSKACDARTHDTEGGYGCVELGELFRDGDGVSRDLTRAFELFDTSCKEQLSTACRDLGRMYRDGLGVGKDATRARTLFDFACKHGDDAGCKDAAAL
jgi:TPR repeat protein